MSKYENKVTCLYCEHHDLRYTSEEVDFIRANEGFCNRKNKDRFGSDELCSDFVLKMGMHTTKWYPGKK